ncbi:MAG: hypothetical protein ACXAAH_10630 [Promethearchaeota archaeon]|jgi:hypothetical protein
METCKLLNNFSVASLVDSFLFKIAKYADSFVLELSNSDINPFLTLQLDTALTFKINNLGCNFTLNNDPIDLDNFKEYINFTYLNRNNSLDKISYNTVLQAISSTCSLSEHMLRS